MKRLMMKTIIDYQNDEREKVLLDVRDKQEFEKETYPGARNWYWEELIKVLEETPEEFTQQFDKSVPIYLLCYTGLHSVWRLGRLYEVEVRELCQGSTGRE